MSISGVFFTNKGLALQAKAQTGTPLHFTRIAIGDGELQGQASQTFNKLMSEKLSIEITKLTTGQDGTAKVGGSFNNSNLEIGFYYRELGLFARDPDNMEQEILYVYGNAGALADYIPAQGSELIEKKIDIIAIIGNATKVSATINSSLVGLGPEDLELHDKNPEAHQAIHQLIQTEENARILGDSQLDAKIKNLEGQIQNINVSGDVRQVINERVNADTSKPLSTLISEWVNTAKTAILNAVSTLTTHVTSQHTATKNHVTTKVDALPQKTVWTDARGAKLDNLNQSLSTTQANINNNINEKATQILTGVNKISIDGKREARKTISITNTTAMQRMVYVTGKGEIYDAYLKISRNGTETCQIGIKIIVDGTVVAWVEGSGIWIADSVLGIISANNEVATWSNGLSFPSSSKVTITEFQHLRLNNPIKFNSSFEVLAYYKSTNSTVCNVSYALL